MNHYDGPAFYRRFLQKPKSNDNQDSYSNNKMTRGNRKDIRGTGDSSSGNFRTNGENMISKMTNAFTPKGNYAKRVVGDEYLNESKLGRYYLKIIQQLDKQDFDCILFDDGLDTRANSDLIQFGAVDEHPESVAAEQFSDDFTSDASENVSGFESAASSHYANPTSDEEYYQRLQNEQSDADKGIQSASDVAPSSKASHHFEPDSQSVEVGDNDADEMNDSVDRSKSSSEATPQDKTQRSESAFVDTKQSANSKTPKRGLGHPLSAILNNEQDAQKDVEFFKDGLKEVKAAQEDEHPKAIARPSDVKTLQPTPDDEPIDEPANNDDSDKSGHELLSSGTEYEHGYQFPRFSMLNEPHFQDDDDLDDWIIKQSEILDRTLHAFHVNAEVVDWTNGPTVTQFQVKLALGVKVSKITNLNDDLKLALAAKDIRIEAPIPGRTTVGVEIPNPKPRPVMLSEVLDDQSFKNAQSPLTIALGVDLTGKPQVTDISKMPHGLIAGATGSGKSVFINSLLVSLLYKATPAQLRLLLIDPKAVELAPYNKLPHLLAPVISEPNEASAALKWAVKEMDERYEKLAAGGARNIEQFNTKADENNQPELKMPYIVIIIDELADLMMVASTEVQDYIVRITQKARAAGIHLIVATQRPSVDIVTGTIKNNIPTRIAFMVSSQVDSRTIIDTAGAERLLGRGDMLYLGNGKSQPLRIQGTFVTNEEIERITAAVRTQGTPKYAFNPKSLLKKVNMVHQQDELMPEVLAYIAKENTVSTSKLQRVFSIGYNRAATLIDDLEQQNYISGQHGSKPREVYLTEDDYKKINL